VDRRRFLLTALAIVLVLPALVGCASIMLSKLPRMNIEHDGRLVVDGQGLQQGCAVWVPQLRLTDVPATATLAEARVTDPDHPSDPPGGWYVPYVSEWRKTVLTVTNGSIVLRPHGIGPARCPPGDADRYQIEVVVRDRQEQPLAYGSRSIDVARDRDASSFAARCRLRGAGARFIVDCQ